MTHPRRGRPKKPPEEALRLRLMLYVTEAEYDAIARCALRDGDSMSALVRAAILEALGITHSEKRPVE